MRPRAPTALVAVLAALSLTSCGGGGGGGGPSAPGPGASGPTPPPSWAPAPLPRLSRADGAGQPVSLHGGVLEVGTVPTRLPRDGVSTDRDGVSAAGLRAFLRDAHEAQLVRFQRPPTLRVASDTSALHLDIAMRAVRIVNSALPLDWQIQVAAAGSTPRQRAPDGEMRIDFAPPHEWSSRGSPTAVGRTTWPHYSPADGRYSANVWIDDTYSQRRSEGRVTALVVHELMHAVAAFGHASEHVSSITRPSVYDPGHHAGQPQSILFPLDRAALRVLYDQVALGASPTSFGHWASERTHARADHGVVSFGTTVSNGYGDPWASGPAPESTLAANAALGGRATWAGDFVGLTPEAAHVIGDAEVAVTLGTMLGTAAFTGLRQAGATWGDGDLRYDLRVAGNALVSVGGDAGTVTGAFMGRRHEAVGGTLRRRDLTGAFGATRE